MSLIDTSYFIKDVNIPVGDNSNLGNDITKFEPEILKQLLGYELWKLVDAYNASTSPQRIKDLVEGKEYTVSYNSRDQLIKWNGLKNSNKISLIAYYVYFMWQTINTTTTSNVGVVGSVSENSIVVSPAQKMGSAWHNMRKLYGHSGQSILEPSAYNFLTEYEDDYEEWIFNDIGMVNMFGL